MTPRARDSLWVAAGAFEVGLLVAVLAGGPSWLMYLAAAIFVAVVVA